MIRTALIAVSIGLLLSPTLAVDASAKPRGNRAFQNKSMGGPRVNNNRSGVGLGNPGGVKDFSLHGPYRGVKYIRNI